MITYSVVVNEARLLGDGVRAQRRGRPGTLCCPPVIDPVEAWTYEKSSNPATGTVVVPGDSITYTIPIANTGGVALTGKTVVDDMSDVLDGATLTAGPTATSGSVTRRMSAATPWTGDLAVDQVVTVTARVQVRAGVPDRRWRIIGNQSAARRPEQRVRPGGTLPGPDHARGARLGRLKEARCHRRRPGRRCTTCG